MNVKHEEKMAKDQNICREINACGKEERKKEDQSLSRKVTMIEINSNTQTLMVQWIQNNDEERLPNNHAIQNGWIKTNSQSFSGYMDSYSMRKEEAYYTNVKERSKK